MGFEKLFGLLKKKGPKKRGWDDFQHSNLVLDTFKTEYKVYEELLEEAKSAGKIIGDGSMQLARIKDEIARFEKERSEKDAIELIHLFYCLEDYAKNNIDGE